ncbi:MAG: hypothetical protein GXP31_02585 [Kiritimatiellaeota bacterium]|nr:hypothetical protein [Kiritimatiellota bacterium]
MTKKPAPTRFPGAGGALAAYPPGDLRGSLYGIGALVLAGVVVSPAATAAQPQAPPEAKTAMPLYAFCGTGDHLWVWEREPVDSPAAIEAMFEWMARTYSIRRMYWRGAQSMMWDRYYRFGPERPLQYDWTLWKRHLYRDVKINEAAVAAARRTGMEIFMYTGLFESGVPPDIGIVGPYLFEDKLFIAHPDWRPLDRWGERRCPGAVCFAVPQVREALVQRYVHELDRFGYDGINFYTYVENCGIRYEDEFGYNPPILAALRRKYPSADPRRKPLTPDQKQFWYECRGRFLTQFLRELHAALSARGKKLSVILDAVDPDYPQPWWGKKIRGVGRIRMQWRTWVREGLVDELWIQLGAPAAQRATLDRVLAECRDTPVRLTVRTVDPFDPAWRPYLAKGVTPVAVITWARNGIERFSLTPATVETLNSPDWRLRLQTVADVEAGRLQIPAASLATRATDPHVLVRRRVMTALGDAQAAPLLRVIEGGLSDPESCVRIAAAEALAKVHGPGTPRRLLDAVARDAYFQMKMACVDALSAMGPASFAELTVGIKRPESAVREVCVRSLYRFGRDHDSERVFPLLRTVVRNPQERDVVRYFAIEGLVGLRLKLGARARVDTARDLLALAADGAGATVRLQAAWGLGYLHQLLPGDLRTQVVEVLDAGFRRYGDGCGLEDAAFGWRVFGNALLQCGTTGRKRLEQMRSQTKDKWLAWVAYEAVHVAHRVSKIIPVAEEQAILAHDQFAPSFPGTRPW